MNTIKLTDKKQTRMVAHRGVCGLERENTNAAFVAAGNRSYYGIETDVHKTADGKFVLIHDGDTYRVSGDRLNVEESTYETIKSIVLYDRDGKKGRTDLRIPDLADYVNICKKYEKVAVLELKSGFTSEEIAAICDIFKEHDYLDGAVFIAFGYDNLVKLRELYPDVSAQFLVSKFEDDLIGKLKAINVDLDIEFHALNQERVKLCHANGIKVNCWTVNDPETAQELVDMGVDFITTNILE